MAVLVGSVSGALVAYDQARDNAADRLLGLQSQVGVADVMVPDAGVAVIVLSNYSGPESPIGEVTRLSLELVLGED